MTNIDRAVEYIDSKIKYLEDNIVTDGVHNIPINNQIIKLLRDIKLYVESIPLAQDLEDIASHRKHPLCFHKWEVVDEWENNLPGCIEFCTKYTCKKCGRTKTKSFCFWPE